MAKKKIANCSPDEVNRYFVSYFSTWDSLQSSKSTLERRKLAKGVSNEELNEIEVRLLWLAAEHAKLKQRRTAFLAAQDAIDPPTQGQVDAIKSLTAQTEKLTNTAQATKKAVQLAGDALTAFNRIQAEA